MPENPVSNQALNERWVKKFFNFRFQGDEYIYLYFPEQRGWYFAKIIVPEGDAERFLRREARAESGKIYNFDEVCRMSGFCFLYENEYYRQHYIAEATEDTFSYAMWGMGEAYEPYTCAGTTRDTLIVVLEPQDGVVVVFVIAGQAKMNTSIF